MGYGSFVPPMRYRKKSNIVWEANLYVEWREIRDFIAATVYGVDIFHTRWHASVIDTKGAFDPLPTVQNEDDDGFYKRVFWETINGELFGWGTYDNLVDAIDYCQGKILERAWS